MVCFEGTCFPSLAVSHVSCYPSLYVHTVGKSWQYQILSISKIPNEMRSSPRASQHIYGFGNNETAQQGKRAYTCPKSTPERDKLEIPDAFPFKIVIMHVYVREFPLSDLPIVSVSFFNTPNRRARLH